VGSRLLKFSLFVRLLCCTEGMGCVMSCTDHEWALIWEACATNSWVTLLEH
jgi:hypothetical protein